MSGMVIATVDNPSLNPPAPARSYYLMAEFRRAALWGIAGGVLITIVASVVGILILQRGAVGVVLLVTIMLGGALWLSQYVGPIIRVDHDGISRRSLWRWDCWTWDSFADGRIRHGLEYLSYEDPARPWWRRTLRIGLLEESEAKAVNALIRRIWTPPPAEPVPENVEFQMSWPDRRRIVMTASGMTISRKHKEREYRWADVISVVIWRLEADRPDFRELQLRFVDQELKLRRFAHQGGEVVNWQGASAEMISTTVCRHVDAARCADYSLTGPTRTLEELDARQARDETRWKNLSSAKWALVLVVAGLVLMPLLISWLKGALLALAYSPLVSALHWATRKKRAAVDEERRKYEEERAAFLHRSVDLSPRD